MKSIKKIVSCAYHRFNTLMSMIILISVAFKGKYAIHIGLCTLNMVESWISLHISCMGTNLHQPKHENVF